MIYVFLYQNLNEELEKEIARSESNLCISILEFKFFCKIGQCLQINLIYVFLYQNLNKIEIIFKQLAVTIYVFLYQNLNPHLQRVGEKSWLDLCISILEFKCCRFKT